MYMLAVVFLVACIKFAIWCVRVCIAGALWIVGTVVDCIGRGVNRRNRKRIVAARYDLEQAKQIEKQRRDHERRQREKMRFEWQQEKMEWARQKEADRREQLEAKRRKEEQAEANKKLLNRRLAKGDILHHKEMIDGIYGEMYREIEQLKKGETAPKEKVRLLNSQAAILNKIRKEEKQLEQAKYNKYIYGA